MTEKKLWAVKSIATSHFVDRCSLNTIKNSILNSMCLETDSNLLKRFALAFAFQREEVAVYAALHVDFGHHLFSNLTLLDLNTNKDVGIV